jgi:replication-associated recombination protein RarA
MAEAPKSHPAYNGDKAARSEASECGNLPIPRKLRNTPTPLMKNPGPHQRRRQINRFAR